jgi:hypothetical protein
VSRADEVGESSVEGGAVVRGHQSLCLQQGGGADNECAVIPHAIEDSVVIEVLHVGEDSSRGLALERVYQEKIQQMGGHPVGETANIDPVLAVGEQCGGKVSVPNKMFGF